MQEACETAHRERTSYLCPHPHHQNPGFSLKFSSFSCKCSKHAAVIHTLLHKSTGEGREVKQYLDLMHDLDL